MDCLVICIFFISILIAFWLWDIHNHLKKDSRFCEPLPPGIFGIPVIGETISFLRHGSSFFDSKLKRYGSIYKTHLFGNPVVRVVGENNVSCILSGENEIVTSHWPESTRLLLNGGLVLERSGPIHSLKKRVVLKALAHKALDKRLVTRMAGCHPCYQMSSLLPVIFAQYINPPNTLLLHSFTSLKVGACRYIQDFVKISNVYINTWCQKERVFVYLELRCLTFHVASKTLAGFNLSPDDIDSTMDLFQDFVNGLFSLPIQFPMSTFRKASAARHKLLRRIESNLKSSEEQSCPNILSFLQPLTENRILDRDDVKHICLDLLFASHETTSSAACFLILYLSKHRDVFCKLQTELEENGMLDADERLSLDTVNHLKYLNNVVKETIRLCCPIGAAYRKVLKTFSLGGYQIPKGWLLAYSLRETHETSEFFTSPRKFNPDRWTDNDDDNSRHFLCFGGGKRRCVGKDFSTLFLKILIIEMMRLCYWNVENLDPEIIHFPSPHPHGGLPVSFKRKQT